MNLISFSPPKVFETALPPEVGPTPIGEIFGLLQRYLQAQTWEEVLELHVPASRAAIIANGGEEAWQYAHDHPVPWAQSVSTIVAFGNVSTGVYLAQSLPYVANDTSFANAVTYFVPGYRWYGGQLLFDTTLESSEAAVIISHTPPAQLEVKLHQWHTERLIVLGKCDVLANAEEIMLFPSCAENV